MTQEQAADLAHHMASLAACLALVRQASADPALAQHGEAARRLAAPHIEAVAQIVEGQQTPELQALLAQLREAVGAG